MKYCKRCGKPLNVGDEAHVVDGEMYCSKNCAVLSIMDEIIMNAKEMAVEQYDDSAAILTVRPTLESAECDLCHDNLADHETIWAAEGKLYCSPMCGVRAYGSKEQFHFFAEEVLPEEIGLRASEGDKTYDN